MVDEYRNKNLELGLSIWRRIENAALVSAIAF